MALKKVVKETRHVQNVLKPSNMTQRVVNDTNLLVAEQNPQNRNNVVSPKKLNVCVCVDVSDVTVLNLT